MKQFAQKPFLFSLTAAAVAVLLPQAILQFLRTFFVGLFPSEAALYILVYLLDLGVVVLLAVLLPGELWEDFQCGFRWKKLGCSLLLCLPMLVEAGYSICFYVMAGCPPIDSGAFLLEVCHALQAGITEELVFRGLILGNFLYQWRGKHNRICASVFVSAVLFSLSHLVNLWMGQELLTTAVQLLYVLAVGFLTGMAYVRTRNILGPVLIHCLHNLITLGLETVLHGAVEIATGATAVILTVKVLSYGAMVGFALFMLRKSRHAGMLVLWGDTKKE